jgi:hypothetical protein
MLKIGSSSVIVNNICYNPGPFAMICSGGGTPRSSIVGNILVPGVNTKDGIKLMTVFTGNSEIYFKDNITPNGVGVRSVLDPPLWAESLTVLPSKEVVAYVLKNAGARPDQRDSVDARIVEDFRRGRGRIIDSQTDVGGYPEIKLVKRKITLPKNMNGDDDGDGYTNLEEWLHELAAEVEGRKRLTAAE